MSKTGTEFVLKQVRRSGAAIAELETILGAVYDAAQSSGAPSIAAPNPLKTSGRQFLFEWNEKLFYLARFFEGGRPSFKRADDVAVALEALARLHVAGGEAGRRLAQALGQPIGCSLAEKFRSKTEKYIDLLTVTEQHDRHSIRMRVLRRGLGKTKSQVDLALEKIQEADDALRCPVTLCHGDTHENNFLIDRRLGGGVVGCTLIDVESFEAICGVEDIVVPLHYLGYYTRWKTAALRQAIEAYEKVQPLSAPERAFLFAALAMPRQWFRAAKSIMKKDAFSGDLQSWRKHHRVVRDIDRQLECVRELEK